MSKTLFFLIIFFITTPSRELHSRSNKDWNKKKKIILIHPYGHAGLQGRKLFHETESSVTKKIAEYLCNKLNEESPCIAIQTKIKEKNFHPLQAASVSNRLNPALFISIHAFKTESIQPSITIYHLLIDPITDFSKRAFDNHTFTPLHSAHTQQIGLSQKIAKTLSESLHHEKYSKLLHIAGQFGIPFKPLVGIQAPAIAIEFGLGKDINLPPLLDPIISTLLSLDVCR